MRTLLRLVSLRHLLGEGPRTALTLLGVALGVGVLVAVRLANQSALGAFSSTVDTVRGIGVVVSSATSLPSDATSRSGMPGTSRSPGASRTCTRQARASSTGDGAESGAASGAAGPPSSRTASLPSRAVPRSSREGQAMAPLPS